MDDLRRGLVINNRYTLLEYQGRGSFGEVWLAHDKKENRNIAIKIYIALDQKGCEEFVDEYKIAFGLKHKNLCVTEHYGVWNNRPFLTMHFCSKGSAVNLVGKLSPGKDEVLIWKYIRDVSSGLAYLHSLEPNPIVHQDIKPGNILMDSNDTFLITDFGISKHVRSTLRLQSTRKSGAGSTAYMAPECFSKHPNPILASDIWSLGASIYELAEGELPFIGMGGVMLKNGAEMVDLSEGWTKSLNNIMHFCLEKESWDRAKAYEVYSIAKSVLDTDLRFNVAAAVARIQESKKVGRTVDTRATQRLVSPSPSSPLSSPSPSSPSPSSPPSLSSLSSADRAAQIEAARKEFIAARLKERKLKEKGRKSLQPTQKTWRDVLRHRLQNVSSWMTGKFSASKRNLFLWGGGIIAVLLILLFSMLFFNDSPELKEAKRHKDAYAALVNQCSKYTEQGNGNNFQALLNAKQAYSGIVELEEKYYPFWPAVYNKASELEGPLASKLSEAASAWADAAKMQAENLGDYSKAIEFYRLALSLYSTEAIEQAYEEVKEATAYMYIKECKFANKTEKNEIVDDYGAVLYANKVQYLFPKIYYDGLANNSDSRDLYIKIINPNGSLSSNSDISPKGYSYKESVYVCSGEDQEAELSGWGNEDPIYKKGTYTIEIWYNKKRIYTTTVKLN